jgi:hypothetical protein
VDEQATEEERERADDRPGVLSDLRTTAEAEARKLEEGPKLPFLGGRLPVRTMVAMAIFVVLFALVWMALWAILGSIGLVLGWIVAAIVATVGVKLAADRMSSSSGFRQPLGLGDAAGTPGPHPERVEGARERERREQGDHRIATGDVDD